MMYNWMVEFWTVVVCVTLNCYIVIGDCPSGQFSSGSQCMDCHCHLGQKACDHNTGCISGHCQYGYKGMPQCQTPCPGGKFGVDCSSVCHCSVGDTCNNIDGLCHSGKCLDAWTGPSCQKRLPELSRPPTMRVDSATAITITWDKWSKLTGIGEGPIAYYNVQYKQQGRTEWKTAAIIHENTKVTKYSYTVRGLHPLTWFSFRLTLAVDMVDKQKLSVPSPVSEYVQTLSGHSTKHTLPKADTHRPVYQGMARKERVIQAPSDVTLISKTTSSLSLHWNAPSGLDNIAYQVGVSLKESYIQHIMTGETIVQTTNNNYYDIFMLLPASRYNITITAYDRTNGMASLAYHGEFWTLQEPIPAPQSPYMINVTNDKMTVEFYALNYTRGPINGYKVIVEETSRYIDDETRKLSLQMALASGNIDFHGYIEAMGNQLTYYLTLQIDPRDILITGSTYIIGDNITVENVWNAPLQLSLKYMVWICVHSELDGIKQQACSISLQYAIPGDGVYNNAAKSQKNKNKTAAIVCGIIFGLIILVIIVFIIIYCLKKKQQKDKERKYNDISSYHLKENLFERWRNLKTGKSVLIVNKDKETSKSFCSQDEIDLAGTGLEIRAPAVDGDYKVLKKSHPILCKDICHYSNKSLIYSITEEYKHLPSGIMEMVHVALNNENHSLNRSVKALAYDINRVKLFKSYPLQNDYINASKVKTHMHQFYIVTQSPMENTIIHFWKMVWEQNVDTIVMLMGLFEDSKNRYEQYWPPLECGPVLYGNIEVQLLEFSELAHYSIRLIELSMHVDEEREVHHVAHFQYRNWTNSGVPHHPIALLEFLYRVHEIHQDSSNIIIHCHLGAGRSGLYIAIDSLLYEGKVTGKVDVVKCVTGLRMERPNLVNTQKQYQYIYDVLGEVFHYRDTRLEAGKFEFTYENMLSVSTTDCRSIIATEFDSVISSQREQSPKKTLKWTDYSAYISPSKQNNTVSKGVPNQTILEDRSMELMIAHIDSHRIMENFMVTLYPNKEEKVFQFWDMVYDLNCPAVVMINDTELYQPPYWPSQGDTIYGDDSSITTLVTVCDPTNTFYIRDIEIKKGFSKSAPKKQTKHFQFIAWPQRKDAPAVSHMLHFMQQIKGWYNQHGLHSPIVVHSANGISRGTLFSVLWTVIDRLEEEGIVDIYRTTRYVRSSVNAAITNLDQYRFLYKAVKEQVFRWRQQRNCEALLPIQESAVTIDGTTSQSSGEPFNTSVTKAKLEFQWTDTTTSPLKHDVRYQPLPEKKQSSAKKKVNCDGTKPKANPKNIQETVDASPKLKQRSLNASQKSKQKSVKATSEIVQKSVKVRSELKQKFLKTSPESKQQSLKATPKLMQNSEMASSKLKHKPLVDSPELKQNSVIASSKFKQKSLMASPELKQNPVMGRPKSKHKSLKASLKSESDSIKSSPKSNPKSKSSNDSVRQSLYSKLVSTSNSSESTEVVVDRNSVILVKEGTEVREYKDSTKHGTGNIKEVKEQYVNVNTTYGKPTDINVEKAALIRTTKTDNATNVKASNDETDEKSAISEKGSSSNADEALLKKREESPRKLKQNVLSELKSKTPQPNNTRRSRFTYTMYPTSESDFDLDDDEAFTTVNV